MIHVFLSRNLTHPIRKEVEALMDAFRKPDADPAIDRLKKCLKAAVTEGMKVDDIRVFIHDDKGDRNEATKYDYRDNDRNYSGLIGSLIYAKSQLAMEDERLSQDDLIEMIKVCLESGADLDNKSGQIDVTALQIAIACDLSQVAKGLMELGANIRAVDTRGWSVMHWAAAMGNKEVAEVLLEKRVGIHHKQNQGYTPAGLARIHKKTGFPEWLEAAPRVIKEREALERCLKVISKGSNGPETEGKQDAQRYRNTQEQEQEQEPKDQGKNKDKDKNGNRDFKSAAATRELQKEHCKI